MLARVFHEWERRLAAATDNRIVRPFEWGLEWIDGVHRPQSDANVPSHANVPDGASVASEASVALDALDAWATRALAESDRFFAVEPCDDYRLDGETLTFPSAITTPHPENNLVRARYFPDASPRGRRRAVLVLPQWNADAQGHVGLCRLLNRFGISALRLSLPYHDARMPPELQRADYIVSSNIGRTTQVCRQAVLDARRAIAWLSRQGYGSIGILGTSLGSCLSMLTTAHEPLIRAAALNHVSVYFADVVWEGLSTAHVRAALDGHIDLERLRRVWMPISPFPYVPRVRGRRILLVYARYDLTFPVALSKKLIAEFERHGIDYDLAVLPCGHYSSGITPFKWMDGFALCRFLSRSL